MISVIQRVKESFVEVNKKQIIKIKKGLLVFVAIESTDNLETIKKFTKKILKLRIFNDDNGNMNLSIQEIKGELMIIPQFTLTADTKKGNRPGFSGCCHPSIAQPIFNDLFEYTKNEYSKTYSGFFGTDMNIGIVNEGPATFMMRIQ